MSKNKTDLFFLVRYLFYFFSTSSSISLLLISIFSSFKSFKEFFKERYNYPLIASTIFMMIGAVYIKFDQSFFLQNNFEWKPDFLILGLFNWILFLAILGISNIYNYPKGKIYICCINSIKYYSSIDKWLWAILV